MSTETDRIEKTILLRAPLARVWRAISESAQFGEWFGMRFDGPFAAGKVMKGKMTPTTVDPEVAKLQSKFDGFPFEITIDRIEPERLFSFRWHPFAIEPGVDYSDEPTTRIEFTLSETKDGVLLNVTETGFDRIPLARRAKAFAANEGGWKMVVTLVEKYMAQTPRAEVV